MRKLFLERDSAIGEKTEELEVGAYYTPLFKMNVIKIEINVKQYKRCYDATVELYERSSPILFESLLVTIMKFISPTLKER